MSPHLNDTIDDFFCAATTGDWDVLVQARKEAGTHNLSFMQSLKDSVYRRTLLHVAIQNQHWDLAFRLLELVAMVPAFDWADKIDRYGKTALLYACQKGNLAMVQKLVSLGFDPLHRDNFGRNALYHACKGGQSNVVEFILTCREVFCQEELDEILLRVCSFSRANILALLLEKGSNVKYKNAYGRTLLHFVGSERRDDDDDDDTEDTKIIVRDLLERNVDLLSARDFWGLTPLAVLQGRARYNSSSISAVLIPLLLRVYWNKVLLAQEGRLALHVILRNTMFPGGRRRRSLRLDTEIGRLGMNELKEVLLSGITEDPSLLRVQDSHGMLPLHVAAERGAPVHVLKLLTFPNAFRVVDNMGGLAIHAACRVPTRRPTLKAIRYLVQTGGEITVRKRDNDGCLPLHLLLKESIKHSLEVVRCLVEAYPESLSCQTADGDLPLFTLVGKRFALDLVYIWMRRCPEAVKGD